jgi:hypothetical protein
VNNTMTMSPSSGLIVRLWRRCCDSARVWIPLGKDVTAEDVKPPQETSAKLAGRWPDAESLIAHRIQALDPEALKDNTGVREPNNDNLA